MPGPADSTDQTLARFRPYLRFLAEVQLHPRWQSKLDASDLVQQTLLEAHAGLGGFRGQTEAELAGWLRAILAHRLQNALRDLLRGRRDARRERSLQEELQASSARLEAWLADERSSPSEQAQRGERARRLAEALEQLPQAQRQAVVLQYWHGWTLRQIADHLGRTPPAVAGLLQRGLRQLRSLMQESAP
jgi:RNA polymerase sigma-70 factor, ECF subfamily